MIPLLLAALLQEGPKPFRAVLRMERQDPRVDSIRVDSGTLVVRPSDALLLELGADRLLVRGGRAVEHRRGDKSARGWDARRTDRFHPVDVWRLRLEELERWFEVASRVDRELPGAVVARAGGAIPPVKMRPGPNARIVAQGRDQREGTRVLSLVPRSAVLREKLPALEVRVDAVTGRIAQVTARTASEVLTWTLTSFEEIESLEDRVFEVNFGTVNMEDP